MTDDSFRQSISAESATSCSSGSSARSCGSQHMIYRGCKIDKLSMKYLLESCGIVVDYADSTEDLKRKMDDVAAMDPDHPINVIWVNFTNSANSDHNREMIDDMRKKYGYRRYIIGVNSDDEVDSSGGCGFDAVLHLPIQAEDLYGFLQKYELVA